MSNDDTISKAVERASRFERGAFTHFEHETLAGFWDKVVAEAQRRGYRFELEETETHIIHRMIRPDGTVAMQARKPK